MNNHLRSILIILLTCGSVLFFTSCSNNTTPPNKQTGSSNNTGQLSDTANAVPQDGILETVTWNLKNYKISSGNVKTNNDIRMIDSLNADLYAFEEVDSKQAMDKLLSRMKGYREIYEKNPYEGNAFVYNTNAIDSVSSGEISDGQNEHAWANRLPFYFSFNYKPGNGKKAVLIYAVVIHAKAGASDASYQRRVKAARELYNYLTQHKPNARIILLGDFNDETNTSIDNGHQSPYKPFVQDSLHYDTITYTLSAHHKTSETNYQSVIDNIIISNEMEPYYEKGSAAIVIPDNSFIKNYGATTSDHYPVWAKFDMSK